MNRKLKLALAALLGFSAACSSVKNAPAKGGEEPQADTTVVRGYGSGEHRVIVMYGVRRPRPQQPAQIDPDSLPQPAPYKRPTAGPEPVADSEASATNTQR